MASRVLGLAPGPTPANFVARNLIELASTQRDNDIASYVLCHGAASLKPVEIHLPVFRKAWPRVKGRPVELQDRIRVQSLFAPLSPSHARPLWKLAGYVPSFRRRRWPDAASYARNQVAPFERARMPKPGSRASRSSSPGARALMRVSVIAGFGMSAPWSAGGAEKAPKLRVVSRRRNLPVFLGLTRESLARTGFPRYGRPRAPLAQPHRAPAF